MVWNPNLLMVGLDIKKILGKPYSFSVSDVEFVRIWKRLVMIERVQVATSRLLC